MKNNSKNAVTKKVQVSVGTMASRKRDEIEKMKALEQQRQVEARAIREKLARELAELEVQERRSLRLHESNEAKTACYALGELVLDSIRAGSITNFSLNNVSLLQLSLEKQELIERVAGRKKTTEKSSSAASKSQGNDSTKEMDIQL